MTQILLNAFFTATQISLVAVSFGLIYSVCKFLHLAHGIVFTFGAYLLFVLNARFGLPLFYSAFLAIVLSAVLGCLIEIAVYRPLRVKESSSHILLISSLGVYVVLQNIISLVFGDEIQSVSSGVIKEGMNIMGARVSETQLLVMTISVILIVSLMVFLRYTKKGKAWLAISCDRELAGISGIDDARIILYVFAIGSALAGAAGVFVALDVGLIPSMGMNSLMTGVVVAVIGGVRSIPGVLLGSLFLSLAQHLGVWIIGSQWQNAIVFVILLIFLVFRPEGFLGKKVRKSTV